jgi:hypothetical protein
VTIKLSDTNLNLVEEEIEITPHIQPIEMPRIPSSQKVKKDELRITKTTPQMKLPEDIIHEMKEIE